MGNTNNKTGSTSKSATTDSTNTASTTTTAAALVAHVTDGATAAALQNSGGGNGGVRELGQADTDGKKKIDSKTRIKIPSVKIHRALAADSSADDEVEAATTLLQPSTNAPVAFCAGQARSVTTTESRNGHQRFMPIQQSVATIPLLLFLQNNARNWRPKKP